MGEIIADRFESEGDARYFWKGRRYSVPASVVGEIVDSISQAEGVCPPDRLVEEAANPDHPMHSMFDWNDSTAGNSWRVHQARMIIGSLAFRVVERERVSYVPSFVSVGHVEGTKGIKKGYRPVDEVMNDEAMRAETLQRAWNSLKTWQVRYSSLTAYAEQVGEIIDQMEKEVGD